MRQVRSVNKTPAKHLESVFPSAPNGMEAMGAELSGRRSRNSERRRSARMRAVKALRHGERGQGLVEYGLILLLVALAAFASLNYFGQKTNNSLSNSASTVGSALS
jgi:Flp pilus assembly pilin Flp